MKMATTAASNAIEAGPSRLKLPAGSTIPPRILIVDHQDSYTHNLLISLLDAIAPMNAAQEHRSALARLLLSRTLILPHTDPLWQDTKAAQALLLPQFDALILSPGPGRPEVEKDFGASKAILDALYSGDEKAFLPILGVCLGHQGIAVSCGAKIKRARNLRHGMSSNVELVDRQDLRWPSILRQGQSGEKPGAFMTTYNSLVVDEESLPSELVVTAFANDADIGGAQQTERIVMAIQHRTLPMWGVQFHPESISSQGGSILIRNFLDSTKMFWQTQASIRTDADSSCQAMRRLDTSMSGQSLPEWLHLRSPSFVSRSDPRCPAPIGVGVNQERGPALRARMKKLGKLPSSGACSAFEALFENSHESRTGAVWLDSARPGGVHSRWSFMARPSWRLRYDVDARRISLDISGEESEMSLDTDRISGRTPGKVDSHYGLLTPKASRTNSPEMISEVREADRDAESGFWSWFDGVQRAIQEHCAAIRSIDSPPFQTGFVGYFGHEMKDESLYPLSAQSRNEDRAERSSTSPFPNAWFAFCDKVIAIDHQDDQVYAVGLVREGNFEEMDQDDRLTFIQSCLKRQNERFGASPLEFDRWTQSVESTLNSMGCSDEPSSSSSPAILPSLSSVDSAQEYKRKIEETRQLIAAGQSYELCLTTEFRGTLPDTSSGHFDLYKGLRRRNPAPFSAFVQINDRQSILCTSPEKFFSCDAGGEVEMKPIKGTLARAGFAKGEQKILGRLRAGDEATKAWCAREDERRKESLFGDAKERAENLMIVDLIRRDLLNFCLPETVVVPSLMGIESYATVHQMVTTVRGKRTAGVGTVMALAKCFPPGSMTGAPKVRSVELLTALERNERRAERGVYSGCLGWLCVDGAANFNVVIRTVCLDGRNVSAGAGGAITYHSNAESEWQEVLDKVGALATVTV